MSFPLGIVLTWLGIAGLWLAFHGSSSTTPFGIYQEILGQGGTTAAPGAAGTANDAGGPASTAGASNGSSLLSDAEGVAGAVLGPAAGAGMELGSAVAGMF